MTHDSRAPFTRLDRRGIALPVALLALVAVTLMVTTVMLTSSSEGAVARAHSDATQSLYDAEAALQRYTIDAATAGTPLAAGTFTASVPGNSGRTAQISVVRLAQRTLPDASTLRTWSLTAEGIRPNFGAAGRAVTAMVLQRTPSSNLNLNVQSAITLGGDLSVNGNAFTVNGASTACRTDGGVQAVQMSDSSRIDVSGNSNKWDNFTGWENGHATEGKLAVDSTNLSRAQLANQVLGNKSLAAIVALVGINKKWCSSTTTCLYKTTASNGTQVPRPLWPGAMPAGDSVAVVDANGGAVEVRSGTGLLIITNGSLLMKGSDVFNGIIIVEGNFTLEGTPTVTGSLISLAMNGQNQITQDQSGIAQGHVTVQFQQCRINEALQAFANQAAPATVSSVTFAWSEIIR
ncbi:MAG TPA: pilus assembly PilX N-terminal domain-containing protein [Longimicrobium sp.]|jgi:Tfp pilus assembly protein PilX